MRGFVIGFAASCLAALTILPVTPAAALASAPASEGATVGGLPTTADRGHAERIATAMAQAIPTAVKVTRITQANDANQLRGRPGGYTSGAWIKDSRTEATGTGTDTGAAIEVFRNATYAAARVTYINTIQQTIGFGHDYLTRIGNVVLRVSEELTPAQYRDYKNAFTSAVR